MSEFKCRACNFSSKYKRSVIRHYRVLHLGATPRIVCHLCRRSFKNRARFDDHTRLKHKRPACFDHVDSALNSCYIFRRPTSTVDHLSSTFHQKIAKEAVNSIEIQLIESKCLHIVLCIKALLQKVSAYMYVSSILFSVFGS